MLRQSSFVVLFGLAAVACAPGSTSIAISYPTPEAKVATKKLAVYAFSQEEGAARARCRDYTNKLPSGEPLAANPVDDPFALDGEKTLTNFPAGDPVIVVVALDSKDNPILQGCTDTYGGDAGYSDVPVVLEVIVPSRTKMLKVAGDRQVTPLGSALPVPLRVRVETAFDMATQRSEYPLPAIPVVFTVEPVGMSPSGEVVLGGGTAGRPFEATTDANGEIIVPVVLPARGSASFVIRAVSTVIAAACQKAQEMENATACKAPSEVTFLVSAVRVDDVRLADGPVVNLAPFRRPVAAAIGNVTGGSEADVVVLGCEGSERGCQLGRCAGARSLCTRPPCTLKQLDCARPDAENPLEAPGTSKLSVVSDILGSPSVTTPMGVDLGVAPGGVLVGPLVPGGYDDIAQLNSRRVDCQDRRCEGSEILVFSGTAGGLSLAARETLTASNAVALVGVRGQGSPVVDTLYTAAQGRSTVGRACSRASMCLFDTRYSCPDSGLGAVECVMMCRQTPTDPRCVDECSLRPQDCGCPPQERCECVDVDGCTDASAPGVCIAQDRFIDRLSNETATKGEFVNTLGCQSRTLSCSKSGDMVVSKCACADAETRGNLCAAEDACGCSVPAQVSIGDQAGVVAHDIAVGSLTEGDDADMVAASQGGIDFLPHVSDQLGFRWTLRSTPISVAHFIRIVKLDRDEVADIVWLARGPCEDLTNAAVTCPLMRPLVDGQLDGAAPSGCMGVLVRVNNNQIETTAEGGCRRYHLPVEPAGVCTGDVNGDGGQDVVISGFGADEVLVYLGDRVGGLLDPPLSVSLPSGGQGGTLACSDLDGDGRLDVLVAVGQTGVVSALRTVR